MKNNERWGQIMEVSLRGMLVLWLLLQSWIYRYFWWRGFVRTIHGQSREWLTILTPLCRRESGLGRLLGTILFTLLFFLFPTTAVYPSIYHLLFLFCITKESRDPRDKKKNSTPCTFPCSHPTIIPLSLIFKDIIYYLRCSKSHWP